MSRWMILWPGLLLVAGCSGNGHRVSYPTLDPRQVSQAAMAEFDTNKDGYLDKKELQRCPGLRCCLEKLDTDKDGRLSAAEIEARVDAYNERKVGVVAVTCAVLLDGRPLSGAEVTLVPEPFLGPQMKPAHGTTNARGKAQLQTDEAGVPGCFCGFYRVVISRKDDAGRETIPARYNTETNLGLEVGPDVRGSRDDETFRLTTQAR